MCCSLDPWVYIVVKEQQTSQVVHMLVHSPTYVALWHLLMLPWLLMRFHLTTISFARIQPLWLLWLLPSKKNICLPGDGRLEDRADAARWMVGHNLYNLFKSHFRFSAFRTQHHHRIVSLASFRKRRTIKVLLSILWNDKMQLRTIIWLTSRPTTVLRRLLLMMPTVPLWLKKIKNIP